MADTKKSRRRLCVDLSAYPDVLRMLERAERQRPGTNTTWFVVDALRKQLIADGYGPKKEMAGVVGVAA